MCTNQPLSCGCDEGIRILKVLRHQLTTLDQLGAYKTAAHLDAAIQQLQRDVDVTVTPTGEETPPICQSWKSLNIPIELAVEAAPQTQTHVFTRKANADHFR